MTKQPNNWIKIFKKWLSLTNWLCVRQFAKYFGTIHCGYVKYVQNLMNAVAVSGRISALGLRVCACTRERWLCLQSAWHLWTVSSVFDVFHSIRLYEVNWIQKNCNSKYEFENILVKQSNNIRDGCWLIASGWSQQALSDFPDRSWIPESIVCPTICYRNDLHAAIVNRHVTEQLDLDSINKMVGGEDASKGVFKEEMRKAL